MRLRLGTRGSRLATAQTGRVAARLEQEGHTVEIRTIRTAGDRATDLPFHAIGPPGVFVREIERALLAGEIDVAVHSYKDLPTASPEELVVAAVPERLDPADRLLLLPGAVDGEALAARGSVGPEAPRDGGGDAPLRPKSTDASDAPPSPPADFDRGRLSVPARPGARVGTSSARREALLKDLRPDLAVEPIRGNVPTRVRKLREGAYDAILLAAAGLERLRSTESWQAEDTGDLVDLRLDPELFVPAPSQGALALQVRRDDPATEAVAALDRPAARREVEVERRLLALVEGGCQVPVGAWCHAPDSDRLALVAVLGVDGELRRASGQGRDPEALAQAVAEQLLAGTATSSLAAREESA